MTNRTVASVQVSSVADELWTGDHVLILCGTDDVFDGQLCRVFDPDQPDTTRTYSPGQWVPVLCWTGYAAWTKFENLVAITGDTAKFGSLFREGWGRAGSETITF